MPETLENGKVPIIEVECKPTENEGEYRLWFVAISGYEGPQIRMDREMLEDTVRVCQEALTKYPVKV